MAIIYSNEMNLNCHQSSSGDMKEVFFMFTP